MPPRPPAEHLLRVPSFLRGALIGLREGVWETALHGAYYACLHTALALLSGIGRTAETHRGIAGLFALHFVKDGPLTAHQGRLLSQVASGREIADYGIAGLTDEAAAREGVSKAVEFIEAALPLAPVTDRELDPIRAELGRLAALLR